MTVAQIEFNEELGEYVLIFDDETIEALGFKEGDTVEWVDNGDGTFLITRVKHG
jgi:bifunctional DNA-binding transcriptional regulator/antitoxin component of YhaV-PrlF toxin-antitoxin module